MFPLDPRQPRLPDEYLVFVRVCICGRPVLKSFVFERNGRQWFWCSCSDTPNSFNETSLERLNGDELS